MLITNKKMYSLAAVLMVSCFLFSACSLYEPAKKPDIGPAGKPTDSKPNPPFTERFLSPPAELYDLEATAGVVFEGINKENWTQSESGLSNLQTLWLTAKPLVGEKKGVKEAEQALQDLTIAVAGKEVTKSYESLNKFMGSISEIAKSYKLSPLSDIIAIDNTIRNVAFYVEDRNWSKAAAKAKELDDTWGQVKPSKEKTGILGETTAAHATVKQLKDAVNAENKGAVEDNIANMNESMGRIREFYRGK